MSKSTTLKIDILTDLSLRFVVDTILFIEPILKKHKITGKNVKDKEIFDNFIKTNILIGNQHKQKQLTKNFDKLRNENSSGIVNTLRYSVCFVSSLE